MKIRLSQPHDIERSRRFEKNTLWRLLPAWRLFTSKQGDPRGNTPGYKVPLTINIVTGSKKLRVSRGKAYCMSKRRRSMLLHLFRDTVPALIVLGAKLKLNHTEGERFVPIEILCGTGSKINRIGLTDPDRGEIPRWSQASLSITRSPSGPDRLSCAWNYRKGLFRSGQFKKVDVVIIGTDPHPSDSSRSGKADRKKADSRSLSRYVRGPQMVSQFQMRIG
jgi:hypothetical protein